MVRRATAVLLLLLVWPLFAALAGDAKRITIQPSLYGLERRGVWFRQDTGEIAPSQDGAVSEASPDWEIWIRPSPPAFRFSEDFKGDRRIGFTHLGWGRQDFLEVQVSKAVLMHSRGSAKDLFHLVKKTDIPRAPVFLVVGPWSRSLVMLEGLDVENEVMHFVWRPLTKSENDRIDAYKREVRQVQ